MQRKRKKLHLNNAAVFLLSLILLTGSAELPFIPGTGLKETVYGAENTEVVIIKSVDDFISLAEKSGDDSHTRDKVFKLDRDLDLTGRDVSPIQTFCGSFDGQGHTISGFYYDGMLSGMGLFRTISDSGEVRDLSIKVNMVPNGNMKNIGGIAGVNYGVIRNCTVEGKILGLEAVGAIAGRNTENGVISSCKNKAEVIGMRRTGGIAGYNEGLIDSCENTGEVNAGSRTAWELKDERKKAEEEERLANDDEEDDGSDDENLDKLIPDEVDIGYDDIIEAVMNEQEVNYTGGIAGVNSGSVVGCSNSAKIGYRHLGYKTGGIVGYERGILDNCKNSGTIYGRKNTGGIAGQLEPYVRDTFSEDSFKKAQEESDKLVGLITALQGELKNEDDNIQQRIDSIRGSADNLRGSISSYKDYYRGKDDAMEADMREHTNAIRDTINRIDPKFKTKKAGDSITALQGDMEKIEDLMKAAEKAAASGVPIDMTGYIGSVKGISSDIKSQTNTLLELAQNAGKEYNELKDDLSTLRDKNNYFDNFLRKAYDSYKIDLRSTDDDLTSQIDTIADEMDYLNDTLKSSDKVVRSRMDKIIESTRVLTDEVNDGFDELTGEIERMRNTKDLNDIFDDISDTSDTKASRGKITSCENKGDVITDINGGGIAGMADTDADLQSDFKVESTGDVSLKREKTKLATITGCINRGAVTVKNNCAGGIAGSMDIGAVERSINFGPVYSTEGDYAGGITGKSGFMIRDSFSMAAVSANQYAGGIAGYGRSLCDNKTLSSIHGVKERYGAVAGDVDREEDTATVSGNIFVDDDLGAIDGLTFMNEATAVTYNEFIGLSGIPREAKSMTVSFMADGEIIKSMEVPYGGSVSIDDYPEIPDKDDKFGIWENIDLSDVKQNTVINASYFSYVTTIASNEAFPVFLVSGKFFKGAFVDYTRTDIDDEDKDVNSMPEGYIKPLSKYTFKIHYGYQKGAKDTDTSIRLLADDYGKTDTAAIRSDDGKYTVINTVRDGRYLVFPFDCKEARGEFYILKAAPDRRIMIFVVSGICIIALIILIQLIRKYGMKKKEEDRS